MIEVLKKRYEDSTFTKAEGNVFEELSVEEGKKVDISEIRKEKGDPERLVLALTSDCEKLPLVDGSFDAIVGSLCLHHASKNMIVEAFRLLKPGGIVCFVDPGKRHIPHEAEPLHKAITEAGIDVEKAAFHGHHRHFF